jgi:hypothetical protein
MRSFIATLVHATQGGCEPLYYLEGNLNACIFNLGSFLPLQMTESTASTHSSGEWETHIPIAPTGLGLSCLGVFLCWPPFIIELSLTFDSLSCPHLRRLKISGCLKICGRPNATFEQVIELCRSSSSIKSSTYQSY